MEISLPAEKKLAMSLDDLISAEKPTRINNRRDTGRDRSPRRNNGGAHQGAQKFARAYNVDNASRSNWKSGNSDWKSDRWDSSAKNDRWNSSSRNDRSDSSGRTSNWKLGNSEWSNDRTATPGRSGWNQEEKTVMVTNVPFDLTWKDVKDAFKEVGYIERCNVEDGVAWVTYSDRRDAKTAIKTYDGGDLNGRTIKVTIA